MGYQLIEDESLLDALCSDYDCSSACSFLISRSLPGFLMLITILIVKMKSADLQGNAFLLCRTNDVVSDLQPKVSNTTLSDKSSQLNLP